MPGKFGALAAGGGEAVQLGAARGREQAGFGAQQRRHRQRVIAGGISAVAAAQQRRRRVPRSLMAKS